jgi:hypothetical protein
LVRTPLARSVAFSVAVGYAFVSMLFGLMLSFFDTQQREVTIYLLPHGTPWWNYPGVLILAPGGVVALPFLSTITMIVVSIGVGLGMTAGVRLAFVLLRQRRREQAGAGLVSSLSGLTPAMIALLTLGACCSTSAAAAAGIGAVAQASGTTYNQLLANAWYLNVFQVAVLGVALLAQEQLLAVYGSLGGGGSAPVDAAGPPAVPRSVRATVPAVGARVLLLSVGTLWALSALLAWAIASPTGASIPSAALVGGWVLQKWLVGGIAVAAALAPIALLEAGTRGSLRRLAPMLRGLLFASGATLAIGAPPPLNGWGVSGFVNQLLGFAGAPGSLGGASPPPVGGAALGATWGLFYLLLGGFAMALALRPRALLQRLALAERPNSSVGESDDLLARATRVDAASPVTSAPRAVGLGDLHEAGRAE